MLVLTFRVERTLYAVPVSRVIEVIPRVPLRHVAHAPHCVVGLLHYRGAAVPVVDLGLLMGGTPCSDRLDTRILLVRGSLGDLAHDRLGLLAEQVNDLVDVNDARLALRPPPHHDAPYLADVFETESGLLQLIDPGQITVPSAAAPPSARITS